MKTPRDPGVTPPSPRTEPRVTDRKTAGVCDPIFAVAGRESLTRGFPRVAVSPGQIPGCRVDPLWAKRVAVHIYADSSGADARAMASRA